MARTQCLIDAPVVRVASLTTNDDPNARYNDGVNDVTSPIEFIKYINQDGQHTVDAVVCDPETILEPIIVSLILQLPSSRRVMEKIEETEHWMRAQLQILKEELQVHCMHVCEYHYDVLYAPNYKASLTVNYPFYIDTSQVYHLYDELNSRVVFYVLFDLGLRGLKMDVTSYFVDETTSPTHFVNQSGKHRREKKKDMDRSRKSAISDLSLYDPLRRIVLNVEKFEKPPEWFLGKSPEQVLGYVKRLNVQISKLMPARLRLEADSRIFQNQAGVPRPTVEINDDDFSKEEYFDLGQSSCFTGDSENWFSDTDSFKRTVSSIIDMHMPDMTTGAKANLTVQIVCWAFELLTAPTLIAFARKIILMGTHYFPENCGKILEMIVNSFTFKNQAGVARTGANWIGHANAAWSGKGNPGIGKLKKMAVLVTLGFVYREKIAEWTPSMLWGVIDSTIEELDMKKSPADLFGYFLECLEWFTQNLADVYETGDFSLLLQTRDPATDMNTEFVYLQNQFHRMSVYGSGFMTDPDTGRLRQRCLDLVEKLRLNGHLPKLGGLLTVRTLSANLHTWIGLLDNQEVTSAMCKTPFAICCFGAPHGGKTEICKMAWLAIAMNQGWDCSDKNTCTINTSEKYQSTVNHQQRGHIDDVNQAMATRATVNESMLLIRLINPSPFMTDQAILEKKGQISFNPDVITITSQKIHMFAHEDVRSTAAVARRVRVYVHCQVKRQYDQAGAIPQELPVGVDPHMLTLYEPVPTGTDSKGDQIIEYKYISFDFGDGNGPLAMFEVGSGMACYVIQQLQAKYMAKEQANLDRVRDATPCEHKLPAHICHMCLRNQAGEPDEPDWVMKRRALVGQRYVQETVRTFSASSAPVHSSVTHDLQLDAIVDELHAEDNVEELIMQDQAGGAQAYMLFLYVLARFYVRFQRYLPSFPMIRAANPQLNRLMQYVAYPFWYCIHGPAVQKVLGIKGLIVTVAFMMNFTLLVPLAYLVPMSWFVYCPVVLTGTCLAMPGVAYDVLTEKLKNFTFKELRIFEAAQRRLLWAKDNKNKLFASVLVIVASVIAFVKISERYTAEKFIDNGGVAPGSAIIPEAWKPKEVHISPLVVNSRNTTRVQVFGSIESPGLIGQRTAYCVSAIGKKCTNAFPLVGNYWILPYHFMLASQNAPIAIFITSIEKNGGKYRWRPGAEQTSWVRIPGHDLVIAHIPNVPPQRDMLDMFSNEVSTGRLGQTGRVIYKHNVNLDLKVDNIPVKFGTMQTAISSDNAGVKYQAISYTLFGIQTDGGMCCSPVVTDTQFPAIIAFHMQGAEFHGRGDLITRRELETTLLEVVKLPLSIPVISSDELRIVGGVDECVHPKHVGRFIQDPAGVEFLGKSLLVNKRAVKMHTCKTPIYDAVREHMSVEDKWKPAPTEPKWLAKHKMMDAISDPPLLEEDILELAYEDFSRKFRTHLESNPEILKGIRKMTLDEAIRGVAGVVGYEPLNLKTSKGTAGLLFASHKNFGSKTTVLKPVYVDEDGEQCYSVEYGPELALELEELKDQYRRHQRLGIVFSTNEKDETLKQSKEHARIFSSAPLHYILLQRIYFLSIGKYMRDYNLISECAVGINAHSSMWHMVAEYLTTFDKSEMVFDEDGVPALPELPNQIACDYAKYDQRFYVVVAICAYKIMIMIAKMAGFSDDDILIMEGLSVETVFPIFEMNGDLVMVCGPNASGHGLTVVTNSLGNSLKFRYIFYKLFKGFKGNFHDFVKLITYGDDCSAGVHKDYRAFNQNTMARLFKDVGIVFTDAQKRTEFPDFEALRDVSFLKRKFRYSNDLGLIVSQLDKDSIYKSLLWHIPSEAEGLNPQAQVCQAMSSALDEMFFYGKEEFNDFKSKSMAIVSESDCMQYMTDRSWWTYEKRVNHWKETHGEEDFSRVWKNQSGVDHLINVSQGFRVPARRTHAPVRSQMSSLYWLPPLRNSTVSTILVLGLQINTKRKKLGGHDDLQGYPKTKKITEMNMSTIITDRVQTMDFADGTEQPFVGYANEMAAETTATDTGSIGIESFFKRPILIATIPWTPELAGFGTTLDPWSLFLGNKRVINRINNYHLLSGNLHLKFVINGNGFYYGRVIADYLPMPAYDTSSPRLTNNELNLTAASQRLHVQIDPTTSSGGEMILPFAWLYDKLQIPGAEWAGMGNLYFRELNLLKHANSGTTPLEINVFAWMDNIDLSFATPINSTALVNQAGRDEYGFDKFLAAATTAASVYQGKPTIQKYARASELALQCVDLIGKAGFSRPPDDDSKPFRRKVVSNLANCDANDGSVKLTVDSKQELSVGSESLNMSLPDEMDLRTICSKQAYIGSAYWDLTHGTGTLLMSANVGPNIYATEIAGAFTFAAPPCMFASLPFAFWRGTMVFRFQVVASSYHRGRLLITWNPGTGPSSELNVVHSHIMDLDKSREMVVKVPWAQAASWGVVPTPSLAAKGWISNGAAVVSNSLNHNGTIGVYVQNTLAVPNLAVTAVVGLNMYVSMEDAEFAVPNDLVTSTVVYKNQSGVDPDIEVDMPIDITGGEDIAEVAGTASTLTNMYMGERISSIRTLLKRYCYSRGEVVTSAAVKPYYWQLYSAAFPYYPGTVVGGVYAGVNKCRNTFINYFTPAFFAQRGGVRNKYFIQNFSGAAVTGAMVAKRTDVRGHYVIATDVTTQLASSEALSTSGIFNGAGFGAEATIPSLQNTLEVEVPFQRRARFANARNRSNWSFNSSVDEDIQLHALFNASATTDKTILSIYVAAAEDYSLLWFQGAPYFTLAAVPV